MTLPVVVDCSQLPLSITTSPPLPATSATLPWLDSALSTLGRPDGLLPVREQCPIGWNPSPGLSTRQRGSRLRPGKPEKQADFCVSLIAQSEKVWAIAVVPGAVLAEIIVDAGESAKSLHRPGMARLLDLVDTGAVDTVIIAKLDRLTRSVADLAELLKRFERRGVSLVSVADSLTRISHQPVNSGPRADFVCWAIDVCRPEASESAGVRLRGGSNAV